ncbi:MAG: SH3 domain-containing protein [Caulobacteraceae bacterium]
MRVTTGVLIVGLLAIAAPALAHAEACRTDTPSGLPVPRWLSLKSGEVNARVGPGEDYRILRVYRVKGLPVMIIAETRTWRRIRDPFGQTAWVISGATSGRRTALRMDKRPVALRRKPSAASPVTAWLAGRAIAELDRCKDGWCRLKASGRTGWAPDSAVWGAAPLPQCR